jgi:predicted phage terminase large subunit-like protein
MEIATNSQPQDDFVFGEAFETLYGGKAGGGKSVAIVMAALLGATESDYSAVLFRKTYPQLTGKGGLIEVSREFYHELGGQYRETDHVWNFTSGAQVRFSHLATKNSHYDHMGKEYHFIGFDEVAHFDEDQYRYLFSRIRRKASSKVKTRMACTSNPGAKWVYERWRPWLDVDHPNPAKPSEIRYFKLDGDTEVECKKDDINSWSRTFIPSSYIDNPALDTTEYERTLDMLPYIERQRLKYGDWKIEPGRGLVLNREWFNIVDKIPDGHQAFRFWDFAATAKKAVSDDPDYTATCYLAFHGGQFYIHCTRKRVTWDTVKKWVGATLQAEDWCVHGGEEEGGASGKVLASELSRIAMQHGRGWHSIRPSGDKVARAMHWSTHAENGIVNIVRGGEDVDSILSELHAFPESSHDDMVDAISGAFNLWENSQAGQAVGSY